MDRAGATRWGRKVNPRAHTARSTNHDAETTATGLPLFLLYALWMLTIFEFEWFVSQTVGGPFYRIPTLLAPVLALLTVARGTRRALYWPMLLFVTMHLGASIFAENAGFARDGLRFLLFMVLLLASSVTFLDTPHKAIVVLKLYLLSFVWYGVQGIPGGRVFWHPLMNNEDSYGPLMVLGMAFAYFFGMAVSSRGWKWCARIVFLVALLGVVASLARGASLAAGLVLGYILLRSPHKLRTIGGVILAAIVFLPIAAMLLPLDAYLAELQSVSEGDDVRTTLWMLAWNVFKESPIVGVGAGNFGVIASMVTPFDESRNVGSDPGQLYYWAVHNPHVQIMAEEGLVGLALWFTMIVTFFRRNARLRRNEAGAQWAARGGGGVELRTVSIGLEGAMVGYLGCSFFYNQLYIHWFWSLLTLVFVLEGLTVSTPVAKAKEVRC
jgi:O-antigen ligase